MFEESEYISSSFHVFCECITERHFDERHPLLIAYHITRVQLYFRPILCVLPVYFYTGGKRGPLLSCMEDELRGVYPCDVTARCLLSVGLVRAILRQNVLSEWAAFAHSYDLLACLPNPPWNNHNHSEFKKCRPKSARITIVRLSRAF